MLNSDNSPDTRVKFDVPHIPQNDTYSCATTSLAMAISHFEGHLLDKDTAWKISGTEKQDVWKYGNDMAGLKKIAIHYGYKSAFREIDITRLGCYRKAETWGNAYRRPSCYQTLVSNKFQDPFKRQNAKR